MNDLDVIHIRTSIFQKMDKKSVHQLHWMIGSAFKTMNPVTSCESDASLPKHSRTGKRNHLF